MYLASPRRCGSRRSSGIITSARSSPIMSSALRPNICSATALTSTMRPSAFIVTTASNAASKSVRARASPSLIGPVIRTYHPPTSAPAGADGSADMRAGELGAEAGDLGDHGGDVGLAGVGDLLLEVVHVQLERGDACRDRDGALSLELHQVGAQLDRRHGRQIRTGGALRICGSPVSAWR